MKEKYNRCVAIFGNQLFHNLQPLQPDDDTLFFMCEDRNMCTRFAYHKHKLVLILSAMRSFHDDVLAEQDSVYFKLDDQPDLDYDAKLRQNLEKYNIPKLVMWEIPDRPLESHIRQFAKNAGVELEFVTTPMFLTSRQTFRDYTESVKKPFMHTFYQRQRKALDILVTTDGKPVGGRWSFDDENRRKLPKNINIPEMPGSNWTAPTKTVVKVIDSEFPDHPGDTQNFYLATTRRQALYQLRTFLDERFEKFGPYEDAIDADEPFLFHSVLSPYINIGLLTPDEVVDRALAHAEEHNTHFPSVEGLVRQLIGWREFIFGVYRTLDFDQNFFAHKRRLTDAWYTGRTGLPPLDSVIQRVLRLGYCHHIERLMIVGNLMLLCRIHPRHVYRWFMELFVDAADWVMLPNVMGMSQFADGGGFATKPYIAGSNYIRKMSNFSKGEWCDIVDGLYWRFIADHRDVFAANPRMGMMLKILERMNPDRKKMLFAAADNFLDNHTLT